MAKSGDYTQVFREPERILTANEPQTLFPKEGGVLQEDGDHATAEGMRLRKPTYGRLRLIGTAIGVVMVILLAIWMANH
jgi:hypothetical protein